MDAESWSTWRFASKLGSSDEQIVARGSARCPGGVGVFGASMFLHILTEALSIGRGLISVLTHTLQRMKEGATGITQLHPPLAGRLGVERRGLRKILAADKSFHQSRIAAQCLAIRGSTIWRCRPRKRVYQFVFRELSCASRTCGATRFAHETAATSSSVPGSVEHRIEGSGPLNTNHPSRLLWCCSCRQCSWMVFGETRFASRRFL